MLEEEYALRRSIAPLAAEPGDHHEFITAFLTRWGNAHVSVKRKRRRKRR